MEQAMNAAHAYEAQLVRARTLQIAGEFHAHGVYRADHVFSHYRYDASVNLGESVFRETYRLRCSARARANAAIAEMWERVSDGALSPERAEEIERELNENPHSIAGRIILAIAC